MSNLTYKIYTLGCKVNQYDSFDLSKKLNSAGFILKNKNVDIAIINTCCVTQSAIHKSKRMINKARKENPQAKIVVIGCWPQVYKKEAKTIGEDIIRGVGGHNRLIKQISNFKFYTSHAYIRNKKLETGNWKFATNKSRYFIKIQDGCEQFCSYCIIPYTRGKFKSRLAKEVLVEVKQAVNNGYKEIVLCGIHLGLYGKGKNTNLEQLLRKLIKVKKLGKIRLSSIEVTEVTNELIKLIAKNEKICQHLHIPLQSGSNKILKSMNRPYSATYYKNKIKKIRKYMPDIAITTDVIVGFPGETKKDFKDTLNLVKEMQFSRLHVFPYSEHSKTPAAKLPGKVEKEEIEQRAKKLRELGNEFSEKYKKRFIDRTLGVVVESKTGDEYKGKTEYYFDIKFNKKDIVSGEPSISNIVKIKFERKFLS